jgi:Immunity protein 53
LSVDTLTWLQTWFRSQCDGQWEHHEGITIESLDNPGWSVIISLAGTVATERLAIEGKAHRSEDDWLVFDVKDGKFQGFCGPGNLSELLEVFRRAVSDCVPRSDS